MKKELIALQSSYDELDKENRELRDRIRELEDTQKDTYERIVELYKSVN